MKPPIVPVLLALAGLSVPVSAQLPPPDAAVPLITEAVPTDIVVTAPAVAAHPERKSPMLKDTELDTLRGGQSLVITNQTMDSIVSGNILKGDYTAGAVTLSDFALSNFNGVGNLLINTGAQVSAQSGMNLTINLGD
ncbi:hypothetical protein SAMN05428974_0739 [Sphingopyxis sp. YR583]|jgi:hypothetical protein|uniref:hypothetical protein n=1 Tax=Sphingopyxis sp. YR583 TaxID=1881047 RepID=UPI0008A79F23|nr:hypothetical protein [Sphingopyxis sp. YR583]SEH13324.1 hypothetical protein SAMN05428974_0739 [Sphingopyxis sp. YR583]